MADTADTSKMQPCTRSPSMLGQTTTAMPACSRRQRRGRFQVAGTDYPGKPLTSRATCELTMELEDARDSALSSINGLWPSNAQENITRRNVNTASSQFLTAPPDEMGIISDKQFQEIFAFYLELPSPSCTPF
eukprot:10154195-Ditylum_brightwellii.AAC.1